jgi:hypothetical protein
MRWQCAAVSGTTDAAVFIDRGSLLALLMVYLHDCDRVLWQGGISDEEHGNVENGDAGHLRPAMTIPPPPGNHAQEVREWKPSPSFAM